MGRLRLLLIVLVVGAAAYATHGYAEAAALVIRASGLSGWIRTAADWEKVPIRERELAIQTRHGSVRSRLYAPEGRPRIAAVLTSGVHAHGIDEPRLVGLARELAAAGVALVTPEPSDLMRFRITPQTTDTIEDAAGWLARERDLAEDGRVGLMGISFSGGLSLVAAGRPSLKDKVKFVFSFGGHGDLPRVLDYLCTGIEPGGRRRKPHDYGLAVLLHGTADRLVPADQAPMLRRVIETFLWASALDRNDKPAARREFARARQLAAALPEPSATLVRFVNDRGVAQLGPRLRPHVGALGADPALSPERSPLPTAPVYLLHGADDNVIPAIESRLLADKLDDRTEVRLVLTRLITHAEVDQPAKFLEVWRLIRFWENLLTE